jgi:hypothetical protein
MTGELTHIISRGAATSSTSVTTLQIIQQKEFRMKTVRQMHSVLSMVLGLVWIVVPAVAQPCAWSALGSGINSTVNALTALDAAAGPALSGLYAGGFFIGGVARWNGTAWGTLGDGMNNTVNALAAFDDGTGPVLIAGGQFTTAGGVAAKQIAKWNGTQWFELGNGIGTPPNEPVRALFDDGTLYAAGNFTTAGGAAANRVAKWDGTEWSALGSGIINCGVVALTVFDDAVFPLPPSLALYAGGQFTSAGGGPVSNIAKWNGTQWSSVGSGVNGVVWALTVFDDGTGPALYAGGQ